jgi:transmembrane sensor
VLTEAATWLMELHDGPLSPHQREKLAAWRQRSEEHERAWQKAASLLQKFDGLPASGATALKNMPAPERRTAVKLLAALLVAGPIGWLTYRNTPWPQTGDHRTAIGERRDILLDDGTQVTLNTDTRIDVAFDRDRRAIHLRRGEILVTTASDAAQPPRPFLVTVGEGAVRALGTRFTVRQLDDRSRVAVFAGAVEVSPRDTASARAIVAAGRQTAFSRSQIDATTAADEIDTAWKQGMLVADRMPMAQFLAELNRYRSGTLQCDPAVARLPVSGAFPLADTALALSMLEQTLPVEIRYFTRYWARVGPASK